MTTSYVKSQEERQTLALERIAGALEKLASCVARQGAEEYASDPVFWIGSGR